MFSKKAARIDKILTVDVVSVKSMVKISSIFVAFLENTNFEKVSLSFGLQYSLKLHAKKFFMPRNSVWKPFFA